MCELISESEQEFMSLFLKIFHTDVHHDETTSRAKIILI